MKVGILADQAEQVWVMKEYKMLPVRGLQLRLYAITDPIDGEWNFYIIVWSVPANKRIHESIQMFREEKEAMIRFENYRVFKVN